MSTIIGVPYTNAFDHWSTVDDAPKMITRAPSGDYCSGVTAKVNRALVSPWAGGACQGMTMWGIERAANVRDFKVPDWILAQQIEPGSSQRNAFIIVTNDVANLSDTDISRLDVFRQYYDAALPAICGNFLNSDSQL